MAHQPDGRLVKPIDFGTYLEPWGEVIGVGMFSGVRTYYMRNRRGVVKLIPWDVIELSHATPRSGAAQQ